MIRIYIIAALVGAVLVAGVQWRKELSRADQLAAVNTQLYAQLHDAETINRSLVEIIKAEREAAQQLQRQILLAERRKDDIARENDQLRDAIHDSLRESPVWASTLIPGSVAAPVRAAVERVLAY